MLVLGVMLPDVFEPLSENWAADQRSRRNDSERDCQSRATGRRRLAHFSPCWIVALRPRAKAEKCACHLAAAGVNKSQRVKAFHRMSLRRERGRLASDSINATPTGCNMPQKEIAAIMALIPRWSDRRHRRRKWRPSTRHSVCLLIAGVFLMLDKLGNLGASPKARGETGCMPLRRGSFEKRRL